MGTRSTIMPILLAGAIALAAGPASAQGITLAAGQTVYVPAYSSIYHGDANRDFDLAVTLSIHNADMKERILIDRIDYYNTSGKVIANYLRGKAIALHPLETHLLIIKERNTSGGVGANFIVKWHAAAKVNVPVIETIMISTKGQQGISFTSRGVPIRD